MDTIIVTRSNETEKTIDVCPVSSINPVTHEVWCDQIDEFCKFLKCTFKTNSINVTVNKS